jgi:hypothetical protein
MATPKKTAAKATGIVFRATKDGKAIGLMTADIKKRNSKIMQDIHVVAVSCILHVLYFVNGDGIFTGSTACATQLCEVLDSDKRANSLRKWFEEIGPFRWDRTAKAFKLNKTKADNMRVANEGEHAKQLLDGITFWAFDPPKPYRGFDLRALIASYITKAENTLEKVEAGEIEEGDAAKIKIDKADLAALKAFKWPESAAA